LRSEEHLSARYKALNPQGFVPTLETDGQVLIQSPAIIEWLEERYPRQHSCLAIRRAGARVARFCCDRWMRHSPSKQSPYRRISAWAAPLRPGHDQRLVRDLDYRRIRTRSRRCSLLIGTAATTASGTHRRWQTCISFPQVESARRFKVDVSRWPRISAVDAVCSQLDAFRVAAPALQPDAT